MFVGYKVGIRNSTQLIKSTFMAAHELRHPKEGLIFPTDRGSNYRFKLFDDYLKLLSVIQSFSQVHLPYVNSVMGSLFSSLKREEPTKQNIVLRKDSERRSTTICYFTMRNALTPKWLQNAFKERDRVLRTSKVTLRKWTSL